jgi:hypothetical protein
VTTTAPASGLSVLDEALFQEFATPGPSGQDDETPSAHTAVDRSSARPTVSLVTRQSDDQVHPRKAAATPWAELTKARRRALKLWRSAIQHRSRRSAE